MKERNDCIDILKFILASFIICLHTIQMNCYTNFFTYTLHMTQRLALPLFFMLSSYFFWRKIEDTNGKLETFGKYILRWVICYIFWSCVHLRFYYFNWLFPTYGVLWFLYALIIGNIIVFALTRLISNKLFIATVAILLTIFMGLGDPWYGAVSMPLLKDIINSYYATWGTMRMGFTYGVLFSLMGYLITKYEANILTKIKNISLSKRIIIFATFFIFYSIEGYYTHIHGYPKEYGFFILSVPVCALVLIAFLYPYKMGNIKITIPYARCLGSMSGLMYYIHILFYNYWVQHYASLYYGIGEFKLDLHAFFYVYIFTTWLAFLIYLLSKKATFLRYFF